MRQPVALLVPVVLIVTACGTRGGAGHDTTASAAVVSFYEAAARHDGATAQRLLSPKTLSLESRTVAPWWSANTLSLTDVRITAVRTDPHDFGLTEPGFVDTTQVTVAFDVTYRDDGQAGASSGPTINFDYVGRTTGASRWRILSIGGGP